MKGEKHISPEELGIKAAFLGLYGKEKLLEAVVRPDERVLAWLMIEPALKESREGPPVVIALVQGEVYVQGDQKGFHDLVRQNNATMMSMQLTEASSEGPGGFLRTKAAALFDISLAGRELYREWWAFLWSEFLEAVMEGNPRGGYTMGFHIQSSINMNIEKHLPELWERLRLAPSEDWKRILHNFLEEIRETPSSVGKGIRPVA